MAGELGCHFLNAGDFIASSDEDGLHFDAPEHGALGAAVARKVRKILAG